MAELTDIENAFVTKTEAIVYPSGINQPSITGAGVRIYAGWPSPQQLDADLKLGICHVSVYPRAEERNTTRFPPDGDQVLNPVTLTLTANGQAVTVGGAMPSPFTPHNLVIFANHKPYVTAALSSDTLNSIAARLAALIAVDIASTSATGPVIIMPSSALVGAVRVGVTGTETREVRRQQRSFQVTVWADTPAHRDAIIGPLDQALAVTRFLITSDGQAARLIYQSSPITDGLQNEKLYRRDLIYSVEYATTVTETQTQVTQPQLNVGISAVGGYAEPPFKTTYS